MHVHHSLALVPDAQEGRCPCSLDFAVLVELLSYSAYVSLALALVPSPQEGQCTQTTHRMLIRTFDPMDSY